MLDPGDLGEQAGSVRGALRERRVQLALRPGGAGLALVGGLAQRGLAGIAPLVLLGLPRLGLVAARHGLRATKLGGGEARLGVSQPGAQPLRRLNRKSLRDLHASLQRGELRIALGELRQGDRPPAFSGADAVQVRLGRV